MKGFSEIVCTVGFLIAGVAEAVNTFTNPGYHLFKPINNSPGGNTVIQAGGGTSRLSNLTSRRYHVLSIISSSDEELHGKSILLNRPSLSSSDHPTIPTLLFSINNTILAHSSGPSLNFCPVELTRLKLALVKLPLSEPSLGPPDNLTGSSSSASFKIQPCKTCVSIPSTAKLPSATGDTLVTAMSRVSATGTVETKTGSASEGSTLSESGSISTGHSGTEEATLSGSASPSKSTSISAAETLFPIAMEKWMVIPLMIVGMFLYPMLAI